MQPSARMLSTAPGPSWRVLMALGRRPCALSCARMRQTCAEDAESQTYFQPFATVLLWFLGLSQNGPLMLQATCPVVASTYNAAETTLTTSLAHSLRSPLRALAPDRKGVHFFSDRVFANRHPSMVKRTHQKEQRSCISFHTSAEIDSAGCLHSIRQPNTRVIQQ